MEETRIITNIPITSIRPDPENLRKLFDNDDITALGHNMQKLGQLEPIKVFPNDDGTYDLLDGERRWRAASAVGIKTLQAIVEERPQRETLICKRISRALQTKGLSKQEEVRAVEEALEDLGIRDAPGKWSEFADKLGGDLSKVRERMRVANLPQDLRRRFDSGDLDYSMGLHLARISEPQRQKEVSKFISDHDLTARFAATQFIPKIVDNPNLPLNAAYDLARHEERWRYAKPTKGMIKEQTIADKLDDIIGSLIVAEQRLEEAAASGDIAEISSNESYREHLLSAINRLIDILGAFLKGYHSYYSKGEGKQSIRSLPADVKALRDGQD